MSRFTSLLTAGALVLAAACAQDGTSPSALLRNGADDPMPENNGGTASKTVLETVLIGSASFPRAKGKAKFTVNGSQRELEAQVEEIVALAGTRVTFSVGGIAVGSALVDGSGRAGIELNTRLGDTVPGSVSGQPVEARTAGGTLIASGSF